MMWYLVGPGTVTSAVNVSESARKNPTASVTLSESNLMVVGHMPFLQRLVSYLTTGSEEIKVYQFHNSGVVCLDAGKGADERADWFIKWTLNPHIS